MGKGVFGWGWVSECVRECVIKWMYICIVEPLMVDSPHTSLQRT